MQQMQNSLRSHCKANKAADATCGGNTVSPKNQWEFQDPKMEVRYGTVPYKAIFCGDIHLHRPYIGLIYGRYLQFRILKFPLKKYPQEQKIIWTWSKSSRSPKPKTVLPIFWKTCRKWYCHFTLAMCSFFVAISLWIALPRPSERWDSVSCFARGHRVCQDFGQWSLERRFQILERDAKVILNGFVTDSYLNF